MPSRPYVDAFVQSFEAVVEGIDATVRQGLPGGLHLFNNATTGQKCMSVKNLKNHEQRRLLPKLARQTPELRKVNLLPPLPPQEEHPDQNL